MTPDLQQVKHAKAVEGVVQAVQGGEVGVARRLGWGSQVIQRSLRGHIEVGVARLLGLGSKVTQGSHLGHAEVIQGSYRSWFLNFKIKRLSFFKNSRFLKYDVATHGRKDRWTLPE